MFGKNKITKPNYRDDGVLNVHSIFDTIQGEGPYAGRRALFIRLQGCNLRCYFCDTDFASGTEYGVDHLVTLLEESPAELIVFTGGEPLAQNITPLVSDLLKRRRGLIQIETAGTCCPPGFASLTHQFSGGIHCVVSPKTPKLNKDFLTCAEITYKYVIGGHQSFDWKDGLPTGSTQSLDKVLNGVKLARPPIGTPAKDIYVSPCDEIGLHENPAMVYAQNEGNIDMCVALVKEHGYRLSLQQHKIVGVE